MPDLLFVNLLISQCSRDFSQPLSAVLTTQALSDRTSLPMALFPLIPPFCFILYSDISFHASAPLFSATPALPGDCVLHWEASSVSPPCCVCIVSLWCVDLQLWRNLSHKWICTSRVIPTQNPTVQDVQLCPVLPTCSNANLPLIPTPTNHNLPHPHTSLLCTTTLQLPSCLLI